MAIFYVKLGGLATGDAGREATTPRTGSFATMTTANYYDNITDIFSVPTTPLADGDFIYVAHTHVYTHTVTGSMDWIGGGSSSIRSIISVDNANADQALKGAKEELRSGDSNADYNMRYRWYVWGMSLSPEDDIYSQYADSRTLFVNCDLIFPGNGDRLSASADGRQLKLIDCNVDFQSTGGVVEVNNGARFEMYGGKIFNSVSGSITTLTSYNFINGGGCIKLVGVDISQVLKLVNGVGDGSDTIDVHIHGCKTHPSIIYATALFTADTQRMLVTNSSSDSAAAEYSYYYNSAGGDVTDQDATGIHRDDTTPYTSGAKISLKASTFLLTSVMQPFTFDFPTRYAKLSTATDTLRIYFASTTALTDEDVFAEVMYPDGTNKQTYNFKSTQPTDILAAGTAHTTDASSTWNNVTSENKYYMDIDTSGDAGADCIPIIRMNVTVASAIIYFDPCVDVV